MRTKIICTIGPNSESPEMIEELIKAGMNIARLNFSHGTHKEHGQRFEQIRSIAKEIIAAAIEGAGKIPVSVKTRVGFSGNEVETWLPVLIDSKPAAITIHGRTKSEMFKGGANWELIGQAAKMAEGSGIAIIGNGDVRSQGEVIALTNKYNLAGVMVGRALMGNPWFFNPKVKKTDLELKGILEVLIEQTNKFEEIFGANKSFIQLRKHFVWYLKGIPGTNDLRAKLMTVRSAAETQAIVSDYQQSSTS